jgi:hypothetical protein
MRSLGTVRARVERLAAVCLPEPEREPLIVHWKNGCQQCPSCAADLAADAAARAEAEASAARARGDAAPVFFWADPLTTCPHCGAPLPL